MSSRRDYFRAVDEIVEYCKNNIHRENLIAIYLAGSVARGDFSPGRSDIDIYLVLKDRNREFEEELTNKAKEITSRYLVSLLRVISRPIQLLMRFLREDHFSVQASNITTLLPQLNFCMGRTSER